MNCKQANTLNINTYLQGIGQKAQTKGNNLSLYRSPIRHEDNASFAVYTDSNRWHDFGTGENGTLIDLVSKMHTCTPRQALDILSNHPQKPPNGSFFSIEQKVSKDKKQSHKPTHCLNATFQPVTDQRLIRYLFERGISPKIWKNQARLKQINYTTLNKQGISIHCFNLAWQTDSDSYELRGTGNFKSCHGNKDITTIAGPGSDLNIFEGFFDYMSALQFYGVHQLKNTTIILNTLANIKKAIPAIEQAEIVNLFLDNDTQGLSAAKNLMQRIGNSINRSHELYPRHHDFNDFILNKPLKK